MDTEPALGTHKELYCTRRTRLQAGSREGAGPENEVQALVSLDLEVPQHVSSLCPGWAFLGDSWSLRGRPLWSITSESPFPAPAVRGRVGVREREGRAVGGSRSRETAMVVGVGRARAGWAGNGSGSHGRAGVGVWLDSPLRGRRVLPELSAVSGKLKHRHGWGCLALVRGGGYPLPSASPARLWWPCWPSLRHPLPREQPPCSSHRNPTSASTLEAGFLTPGAPPPGPRAYLGFKVKGAVPVACSPASLAVPELPRSLGSWAP